MELVKAEKVAYEVVAQLQPFCSKIEVAGSIRRHRPIVHDIDLVCIPSNQGQFLAVLQGLGRIKIGGGKIIRVGMGFSKGIDLDVYIATPATWATLLLIRTGSAAHNIRMCSRAKNMGMKLHADGSGLFFVREKIGWTGAVEHRDEELVASESEEQIFKALGLPYEEPDRRE